VAFSPSAVSRFFVIFRAVCREFLYYSQAVADKPPEHWECDSTCDECRQEKEDFEENLKTALTEQTGDKWRAYDLRSLLQTVIDVSDISGAPEMRPGWTIKTDKLVQILKQERARIERIERYNTRTTP
jgi:hypothetical protein